MTVVSKKRKKKKTAEKKRKEAIAKAEVKRALAAKEETLAPMRLNNYVLFGDTHVGCGHALCRPDGFERDEGGLYMPSDDQKVLYEKWDEFWNVWVPEVTMGEPYGVIHLGDSVDGVHHGSVTQISHNLIDQGKHAAMLIKPIAEKAAAYFHIRGTEAHVGTSGQQEEDVARQVGAIPDKVGRHARYELWFRIGDDERGGLGHAMHHIGCTGSSAYESSAIMRELTEAFVEAGRWGDEAPRLVVRGHRHRHLQIRIPGGKGDVIGMTTPAWQFKTPFTSKIAGGRLSQAQVGGCLVRFHRGELYIRNKVWRSERPAEVG